MEQLTGNPNLRQNLTEEGTAMCKERETLNKILALALEKQMEWERI